MEMITTIIFDFAGVMTTKRCFSSFAEKIGKKYGVEKDTIEGKLRNNEYRYLAGRESTQAFWHKTCAGFGIPYGDFVRMFMSWYTLNKGTVKLIRSLRKNYLVVMHSDNFAAVTPGIRSNKTLQSLFRHMYFSNEIHMLKAHKKTFRWILRDLKKSPNKCVFIDDQKKNIDVARSVGIHTILFHTAPQIRKSLAKIGVK